MSWRCRDGDELSVSPKAEGESGWLILCKGDEGFSCAGAWNLERGLDNKRRETAKERVQSRERMAMLGVSTVYKGSPEDPSYRTPPSMDGGFP